MFQRNMIYLTHMQNWKMYMSHLNWQNGGQFHIVRQ